MAGMIKGPGKDNSAKIMLYPIRRTQVQGPGEESLQIQQNLVELF